MATQKRSNFSGVTIRRASAQPPAPKIVKAPVVKKKAKWDDKAKARLIAHFKKDLSVSHGVKR